MSQLRATKRVLVTNDDGIDAEGLRAVVSELVNQGYEPYIVAPSQNHSGHSSSIAVPDNKRRVHFEKRVLEEAPDALAYAIEGPPALCALLGIRGAFGVIPDLCISGINEGYNIGPALRFSGTIGAGLTAAGVVPTVAVSAECDFAPGEEKEIRYDTAAKIAVELLQDVAADQAVKLINVNVPALDIAEIAGYRTTEPSTTSLFSTQLVEATDSYLDFEYAPVKDSQPEPGSDADIVRDGYVSITSVGGLQTSPCPDVLNRFLKRKG